MTDRDYLGTKTEANLKRAFAAESEARNRYTFFASVARKEGYEQIAELFQKTADNEKEHAKIWFKALGDLSNTRDNLVASTRMEYTEWSWVYREMAKDAEEEGFAELASKFRKIAAIEKAHEERFQTLLHNLEFNEIFEKKDVVVWECRNCGHIEVGTTAPDECPVCLHPKNFFEVKKENY